MYNSSLAPDVVKTAIDLVFFSEFGLETLPGYATANTDSIFKQDSIDRSAIIVDQFQGPGYFESKAEMQDVPQGTLRVGNQKTFSVLNWAKSVDISKNLMDDDQHSTIDMMIKAIARNGRLTQSKNALNSIFNLGFTTTLTNDGIAVFSNSHVALDGSTIDNLETGVLNEANLDVVIQSLINQKTQDGTLGGHEPAVLLVPPALFKTAQIVAKSTLRSATANNDMNYYSEIYPGLQIYQSPFMGASYGGSDTAWFLLSKDHSIKRWIRKDIGTDLVPYQYQRNNNYIYKAEYREVVGAISFEGVVGSNGTV